MENINLYFNDSSLKSVPREKNSESKVLIYETATKDLALSSSNKKST
jgi:hypothetical protein